MPAMVYEVGRVESCCLRRTKAAPSSSEIAADSLASTSMGFSFQDALYGRACPFLRLQRRQIIRHGNAKRSEAGFQVLRRP